MSNKFFWLSIVAIILSFIGGFLLANSFNKAEVSQLRTENERLKTNGSTLTSEEINTKVAEADQNPQNFSFQKNLGVGLYRYGALKQDSNLINQSVRILERARSLNNTDNDVAIALGNAYFDIAFFNKENAGFENARKLYNEVLERKPDDTDVRTDLGLTYFLTDPADDVNATDQFKQALKINPKHERALQFIVQSLLRQKKIAEAEKYLGQLKTINPSNETVKGLSDQIASAKGEQP